MIDWKKPIEFVTSVGTVYPARLVCSDAKRGSGNTHIVLYKLVNGKEDIRWCDADGKDMNITTSTATVRNVETKKKAIKKKFFTYTFMSSNGGLYSVSHDTEQKKTGWSVGEENCKHGTCVAITKGEALV